MSSILESLMTGSAGIALSSRGTPLQRLNYFDGKFLRAEHLREEQDYLRALVSFANQASGVGIVHGFEVERADGDLVRVYPGLATDPGGRTLLLQGVEEVSMTDLIAASVGSRRSASSSWADSGDGAFGECDDAAVVDDEDVGDGLWLISAHPSDRLCGSEDVYGLLCEQACYTDTQHPYIREGVLLRARPLDLGRPLASSSAISLDEERFWRSRVASAWFAEERTDPASLISAAGLRSGAWCRGADARVGNGVALAVVGRRGATTSFLDLWTVRRERMEGSPRRYWAFRMAMRPWDVFLAQVLQFQCQLTGLGRDADPPAPGDDCHDTLSSAAGMVGELKQRLEGVDDPNGDLLTTMLTQINALGARIQGFLERPARNRRILLEHGIMELPSAGYLPVSPGDTPVEDQVRALMGEGVDLRFCAVRPDFVAHALEEAQHMDRISLVQGLDDPQAKPRVDILVPDGEVGEVAGPGAARGYDMTVAVAPDQLVGLFRQTIKRELAESGETGEVTHLEGAASVEHLAYRHLAQLPFAFHGSARAEATPGGGAAFHYAGIGLQDREAGKALLTGCVAGGHDVGTAPLEEVARPDWRMHSGTNFMTPEVTEEALLAAIERRRAASEEGSSEASEEDEARIMEALREAARAGALNLGENANVETVVSRMVMAAPEPASAALWTSMTADRDPFTMAAGGITPVRFEVEAVIVRQGRPLVGRMTVQGHLTVEEAAAPSGAAVEVRGILDATTDFGAGEVVTGVVSLRKTPGSGGGPSIAFSVQVGEGSKFDVTRMWSGSDQARVCVLRTISTAGWDLSNETQPALGMAEAGMAYIANSPARSQAAADQTLDPGALKTGSAAFADAMEALDLFRQANPSQAALRQRRLFADARDETADHRIRARHGWVLFHRRRDKDCGPRAPEAPVRRDRLRAVYAEVTEKDRRQVLEALASLDEARLGRVRWQGLGTVEFRAGERNLHDAGSGLRGSWQSAGLSGRTLRGAAVAATDWDAVGGQGVGQGRLDKIVGGLGTVAGVGDVQKNVLASVPGGVSPAGTDGVVLLVADTADVPEAFIATALVLDARGRGAHEVKVRLTGCGPQSVPGSGRNAHCTSAETLGEDGTDRRGRVAFMDLEADRFYQLEVVATPNGELVDPARHVFKAGPAMPHEFVFKLSVNG